MIGTRRRLLAVLVCVFALVFALGIMSACGNNSAETENEPTASAQWLYGTEAPSDNLGKAGDRYLDTESLRAYVRSADGQWVPTNLYSGTEDPDNAQGEVGDLYLNTESGVLSQKESNGLWKVVLTVKGEKGRDGVMWFAGALDPDKLPEGDTTLKDARAGDFYLNTNGFSVYQLGADGVWVPLGEIKGDPGKDSVHFFDGEGAPEGNEAVKGAVVGDLYLGVFKGIDGKGAGSRLYRYEGEEKGWKPLMDTVREEDINIHSLADLDTLAQNIAKYDGYRGKVVHLKTDLVFETEAGRGRRAAQTAADWTPIGTSEAPFRGTFDGEDHTIYNFKTEVSTDATKVGFFGNVEGATIHDLHFVNVTVDATVAESSSADAVGAVVVGQAQGATTVKNVTVKEATVQTEAETKANVGGLVGKLKNSETEEETSLKVEGSSFEGTVQSTVEGTKPQSVDSLVADKNAVSDGKVTLTDSSVTDGEGNKTAWDESGKHYAEDTEGNLSYFVGSAQDITDLLSEAEGSVNVALENDLTLAVTGEESFTLDLAGNDLVLDLAGKNLTLNTEEKNAQFTVSGGSKLTVTNNGNDGVLNMGRVENKPVISVQGNGSELNFENVTVEVSNTYTCNSSYETKDIAPAITAENGGTVNIGNNSSFIVNGKTNSFEYAYKEPQLAAASGEGSVINIEGENITIDLVNATGMYAKNGGKINFRNGTINMVGGGCCVGLGLGEGDGEIVFSGGTINITGEISGKHISNADLQNVAIAIGSTQEQCDGASIIINGGTINLAPTSGIAIAVGGFNNENVASRAYVGDGAEINLLATKEGYAYVAASQGGMPCLVVNVYSDTQITGEDSERNLKAPDEEISGGLTVGLCDKGLAFRPQAMPTDYTKEAMGLN